jgi:hypothetical protein
VVIVDHHDRIFSGKGRRVTLVGDLIDFHALGEGPRGHKTFDHAKVPELVLDEVGVVWASLFKELLKVVCGRLRLTHAATCSHRSALHIGAAYLLVDAVVISDSCGLLTALLAPVPAALGALLGILNGDIGRCSPVAAQGWAKLRHHVVDGVLGGDALPHLSGVLEGVG